MTSTVVSDASSETFVAESLLHLQLISSIPRLTMWHHQIISRGYDIAVIQVWEEDKSSLFRFVPLFGSSWMTYARSVRYQEDGNERPEPRPLRVYAFVVYR